MSSKSKSKREKNGSKTDLPDMKTNSDTKDNTAKRQNDNHHVNNI